MTFLSKSAFVTKFNDSSTGIYRDGQAAGAITEGDHRTQISDTSDSAVFYSELSANRIHYGASSVAYLPGPYWDGINQRFGVGAFPSVPVVSGIVPGIQLLGTSASAAEYLAGRFSSAASVDKGRFGLLRSRAASPGSFAIVANGDHLGALEFYADDGVDYASLGAQIRAEISGTPGSNDVPTKIVIATTADGASSPTDRVEIGPTGAVTVVNLAGTGNRAVVADANGLLSTDTAPSIDTIDNLFDDFSSNVIFLGATAFNNGGGLGSTPATSVFGVDNTEKCCGVLALSTSTSTAGGSALQTVSATNITFGFGFTHRMSWRIAIDDLSDGTDTYTVRVGFLDSHNGTPTDGAYFRYTHSVNSGKWQAVTVSNSTETAEDTGITSEVDIFHVFEVIANSDATQVDFYIDGVKTNDITTNIINSSARLTGYCCTIEKTAGATARVLYADYCQVIKTRTTAR